MRVLILGGHGFIGLNLLSYLKDETSYQIYSLSRRNGLDLTDYTCTERNFRKIDPDIIFNCAAHVGGLHYVSGIKADVLHDNMQMELNIYKAVQQVCPHAHIINPLSNCAYPGERFIFYEKDFFNGDVHPSVYPYGHAKRLLYVTSVCYADQYNIKTTNLLIPNSYGPGDREDPNKVHALNGMIIRMLQAWKNRERAFEIWGTGRPIREWVYVNDIAKIMTLSAISGKAVLEPVNIAQNKGYSISETAAMIASAIGFTGEIKLDTSLQDGAYQKIMDATLFKNTFPNFNFIDHYEGICRTVEYYKSVLFKKTTSNEADYSDVRSIL